MYNVMGYNAFNLFCRLDGIQLRESSLCYVLFLTEPFDTHSIHLMHRCIASLSISMIFFCLLIKKILLPSLGCPVLVKYNNFLLSLVVWQWCFYYVE